MFPLPNHFGAPRPPQPPPWQWQQQPFHTSPAAAAAAAAANSFWQRDNVRDHVKNLQETIAVSRALISELEEISLARSSVDANAKESDSSLVELSSESGGSTADRPARQFVELASEIKISQDTHKSMAIDAANYLCSELQHLLAPISPAINQVGPWEERSAMVSLAQKLQKYKRNKRWRKMKRKHVSDLFQKESADYDRLDQEADEWRARQIANDIAKRKVENMKQIAKKKANEERRRLESELELALMVEKIQELRSIRVQKLKKQGHFLPEEDDKYLERVKAAVEEEERQAANAARTDAAKDAIFSAEESRKAAHYTTAQEVGSGQPKSGFTLEQSQGDASISEESDHADQKTEHESQNVETKGLGDYDSVTNLPFEFYHYYHGSSYDMGTLIEAIHRVGLYRCHRKKRAVIYIGAVAPDSFPKEAELPLAPLLFLLGCKKVSGMWVSWKKQALNTLAEIRIDALCLSVRRMWDSFIRPGGSRIPGNWVLPPPPADEVWASYVVQPR